MDYGLMIFADSRYHRRDKKDKLPQWIKSYIEAGADDITTDHAIQIATSFFKEMGQEFEMPHELLLTAEKI
jgi:DNA excision repair protein ERCC-2